MDTKQQIIEAAFELFCEEGYHLSVAELADAVGIKTPSLYSHFSGKDQILEVMIQKEINRYFDCLEVKLHDVESMSCKDAMKAIYLFIMAYFSDFNHLRFWKTVPLISNQQLRNRCSRLIAEKEENGNKCMRQCFLRGIKNGELRSGISESALYLYFVMIQGVLDGMLLYPKGLGENNLAEGVFDSYWEGVRAAAGEQYFHKTLNESRKDNRSKRLKRGTSE